MSTFCDLWETTMNYLDNSSSTFHKPYCVKKIIKKTLKFYMANPGRSGHNLSLKAGEKVLDARFRLANHFGLEEPSNVIFTASCTESLNLALQGTVQPGKHIIATIYEHNSVLRTLEHLKDKYNITYTLLQPNKDGIITPDILENAITPKTYLVVVNHTSNVTGHTQDIHCLGQICKSHHLLFLVDTAQSGGHEKIDMVKDHIHLLAVAGHKGFHSVQCGALLIRDCKVIPLKYGGTGTNSISLVQPTDYPEGLESGTCNIINILALDQGICYIEKHWKQIEEKTTKLTKYLLDELSLLKHCKIYSNNPKSGVVSFLIDGYSSTDIATYLNDHHICVRSGLHCAPKVHEYLSTTQSGLVRVSLCFFTKLRQIKHLIKCLNRLISE